MSPARLYQAACPPQHEAKLLEAVARVADATAPFRVALRAFGVFWETFLFWDIEQSPELTALHLQLLAALNPLREGKLLPIHGEILADERVPAGCRESIRRYGNPLCESQERPHITLTRLKDPARADAALRFLDKRSSAAASFIAQSLWVTDVGPHGTCRQTLREFPLSG